MARIRAVRVQIPKDPTKKKSKRKIKKLKLKKYPKKPKQSAPLRTWQRWKEKVDDITRQNALATREHEATKRRLDGEEKQKKWLMQYTPNSSKKGRY